MFIPPKNVKSADKLAASAGELAIQPLVDQLKTGVVNWSSEQSNTLRALAKIPGAAALQALHDYIQVASPLPALAEGLKLWKIAIDPEGFARVFLAPLFRQSGETHLRLYRVSDLRGLEYLTTLEHLELEQCKQLEDLTPLAGLQHLKRLRMPGCERVRDIAPLAALTKLEELNLSECSRIVSLAPLAPLSRLHEINLNDCRALEDIDGLINKPELTELRLRNHSRLTRIPFVGLPDLRYLEISNMLRLKDIRGLGELSGLDTLEIYGCPRLKDLTPLAKLKQLRALYITQSTAAINDLSPLTALENIEVMNIDVDTIETFCDWSQLQKLSSLTVALKSGLTDLLMFGRIPRLERFSLHCLYLGSYRGIEQATQLTSLAVTVQNDEDIEPLASFSVLPNLSFLYANHLKSENFCEIAALPHMSYLSITASKHTDSLDGLCNLPVLRTVNLSLHDSPVRDLRPLLRFPSLQELTIIGISADSAELSGVQELQAAGVKITSFA
jgi:internalin A